MSSCSGMVMAATRGMLAQRVGIERTEVPHPRLHPTAKGGHSGLLPLNYTLCVRPSCVDIGNILMFSKQINTSCRIGKKMPN